MIVSDSGRFIFVHCRKVAGSSMKVGLAPFLKDQDIVIGSLNEIIAAGLVPPPAIKKIMMKPTTLAVAASARVLGKSWPQAQNIAVKRHFSRSLGRNPPHPSAAQSARFLGERWRDYTKVCFTRNPYERVASDYFWRLRTTTIKMSFIEYLKLIESGSSKSGFLHYGGVSNWEMMTIKNNMQMDFVGRFENIEADYERMLTRIGLPVVPLMFNMKKGSSHHEYHKIYGSAEKAAVRKLFAAELGAFGYQYPY